MAISIRPSDSLCGLVSFKLDKVAEYGRQDGEAKIKHKSFASGDYNTVELDYKTPKR